MKKILGFIILSFFTFQIGMCNENREVVKESTLSNGVKVFLHSDFRTPSGVVGIIFPSGLFNVSSDKRDTLELISENILNEELTKQADSLGASCNVNLRGEFLEISAVLNSEDLKEFLELICTGLSNFKTENFEILKKQKIIDRKLKRIAGENAVTENIFSNIKIKGHKTENVLLNESLDNITEDQCKTFYYDYMKKSPMAIVVCGAIDHKRLIKLLQQTVSQLPKKNSILYASMIAENDCRKTVSIVSKFAGNELGYVYRIPMESKADFREIYGTIFSNRLEKFLFDDAYPLISSYDSDNFSKGDTVSCIYLTPKKDVSLNDLKKNYDAFLYGMSEEKISADDLSDISNRVKTELNFLSVNLMREYVRIRNAYLEGKNVNAIYSLADDIKKVDPASINTFTKEVLLPNLLLEFKTRYKADE